MLSNAYFYHQLTRKYVVTFGNMFNNITLKKINKVTGGEIERIKVPIVYAPKEKYFTRLRTDPDFNRAIQTLLPRMSFEITGMSYDASRKQNSLLRSGVVANTSSTGATQYMGVPYDINFELVIYARNVDDGTQIAEQILPYFNPDYTVTTNMVPQLGFLRDVPIILNNVSYNIEHEGGFDQVRYVNWTLSFTMKGYYYGPVQTPKIIRTVFANIYEDPALATNHVVKINTSKPLGNSFFKQYDTVYAGNNPKTTTAYGVVSSWDSLNNILVLERTQGQFLVNTKIHAASTNAVCNILSFQSEPVKYSAIKITPNPLTANSGDDFGFTTTINEWDEGGYEPPLNNYQPSADSDVFTADNNNLTVDTE
jgi:hypothetical protein